MDPLKALMSVMMASPSSPAELASSAPATPKADKRGRDDADGGSFVDKIKTPKSDPSTPIVGLSAWSINSPVRTSPAATTPSMVDDAIAHRSSVVVAAALFTTTSGYCHNCGIDGHWSRECPNVWAKMCARKTSPCNFCCVAIVLNATLSKIGMGNNVNKWGCQPCVLGELVAIGAIDAQAAQRANNHHPYRR